MSLFQTITDFFESIFKKSSPEVQKKQALKKLELEIREFKPLICKNGMLQPNFAESVFGLYKNCKPLDSLFLYTVNPNDIQRQKRFEAQLIVTGYTNADQELLTNLSFENRKLEILAEPQAIDRIYLRQRKNLEKLVKELNTENFKKMDTEILNLRQFVDFCHYSFVPFLQLFDTNFIPGSLTYQPSYIEIPINRLSNLLEDLYYQTSGLKITTTLAEQVIALAQLKNGSDLNQQEKESYIGNLKKINYILSRILNSEKLKTLICLCKQDLSYEPKTAMYSGSPRQEFANMLQSRFESEEQRIKSEIQEETISEEVNSLFGDVKMEELSAYNQNYNSLLQENTSLSFKWILPLKILKTFLKIYLPQNVKGLLNDIVVEGFFNNPSFKSTFSTIVYAAINAESELQNFEDTFGVDKKNSISVLESYIKDSKKDKDFYKQLEKMVHRINEEAHYVLQTQITNLVSLYRQLGELLADAKKPSSEIISNLKVLMMSSRNRDNTNFLESQYGNWNIFFEIMKNYVIISIGDIKHE